MADTHALQAEAQQFRDDFRHVHEEVAKVIVGQQRVVEGTLVALMCGGNVLLEGVPGLGKTELVKTLGRVLDLDFKRIQFTPDLMPADVIGTNIMTADNNAPGNYRFEFRRGPVFTQLLLADEINRATPKTQSALLEVMQEHSVTVAGQSMHMVEPFFVMATQNPIEQEGTYPLPEAQLDRFMFKIKVEFLSRQELNDVVSRTILRQAAEVDKVMDGPKILAMRKVMDKVVVADPVRDFACRLVLSTHPESEYASEAVKRYVRWGASPRAAQALIRAGRVRALSDGRAHLAFEDITYFAPEVLQHRVLLNYDGQAEGVDVSDIVSELSQNVAVEAQVG
jgi:MoxR-like ATPase